MNKTLLYVAKEPDDGVISDLKSFSDYDITVCACNPGYVDYYKLLGYNTITSSQLFAGVDMKFDVVIGNPPYQSPNLTGKKGKGGNNSLYIKFIHKSIDLAKDGSVVSLITPPAALIKSTIFKQLSPTLEYIVANGSLEMIDLTVNKYFPKIGCSISRWVFVKGKKQGDIRVVTDNGVMVMPIEQLFYLTPNPNVVEISIFNKLVNNTKGELLTVVRGKNNQPCTMARFGYPKVQRGGSGVLGFDEKFYDFFTSKTGLWLLDYIRRHDQMIYHNLLSGLIIGDVALNDEEMSFINSGNWVNMNRQESVPVEKVSQGS